MKYFVHRYDVVRVKVAVEAENHKGAMIAADQYLAHNHPIANAYNSRDEGEDADFAENFGYPTWLHYEEPGQEIIGYLIDEVGDDDYIESTTYDGNSQPVITGSQTQSDWPRTDWQYDVANGDTSLGYVEWVSKNRAQEQENG